MCMCKNIVGHHNRKSNEKDSGLDYWSEILLVFTHVVVSLIDSHL